MRPQIIAHRGASYLAPENTLAAFRKAKEVGADGVEMDVQRTLDGKLLIHHDYIIDLHTRIYGNIYDMLEGDLRALDFGSWKDVAFAGEQIPTLEEALAVGGQLDTMMVELKSTVRPDDEFVGDAVEQIARSGHADKTIVIAFQHDLLRQAKQLMPEIETGALIYGSLEGYFVPPPIIWKDLGLTNSLNSETEALLEQLGGPQAAGLALEIAQHPEQYEEENCPELVRWVDSQVTMLRASFPGENLAELLTSLAAQRDPAAYARSLNFKPDYISCEYHTAFVRPNMVQELHEMGIKTAFWTVDTRDAVRSLLPLQPDAFVTNRPEKVREWIEEEEKKA